VPCITTIQGAAACVQGIEALVRGELGVRPLQAYHAALRAAWAAAAPGMPTGEATGPTAGEATDLTVGGVPVRAAADP
jgi:carbamoyl-phosphate synthase large subunit